MQAQTTHNPHHVSGWPMWAVSYRVSGRRALRVINRFGPDADTVADRARVALEEHYFEPVTVVAVAMIGAVPSHVWPSS